MQYLEQTYTEKILGVYLKLKFSWAACILSGNLSGLQEQGRAGLSHLSSHLLPCLSGAQPLEVRRQRSLEIAIFSSQHLGCDVWGKGR
jgi:hypothetical protein